MGPVPDFPKSAIGFSKEGEQWHWATAKNNTLLISGKGFANTATLEVTGFFLSEMFEGGHVFQTHLVPDNFHRGWVPVNGKVRFDPMVIPGCLFSKLVLADHGGAMTTSTPCLAEANGRGLIVFETQHYGRVCCLPLGMSEASTVQFDKAMKKGADVPVKKTGKPWVSSVFKHGTKRPSVAAPAKSMPRCARTTATLS